MKLEDEIKQKQFRTPYHKAVVNLMYTNNWFVQFQNAQFKPFGLNLPLYNILRILRGQHPKAADIKMMQERMLDKSQNPNRLVEALKKKELAKSKENKANPNIQDIVITKKGLQLLEKLDKENYKAELFLSNLTLKEINQLNELLDKMRGNEGQNISDLLKKK